MACSNQFFREKHIKYFKRCLQILPERLASMEVNRLTIAFFAISGLDLLNALNEIESEKEHIIEWIYSLQVLPDEQGNVENCGFRGSSTNGFTSRTKYHAYDSGHIAMTYTGLASLIILGDDLSRVNRTAVIRSLTPLQKRDGSFQPVPFDSENDMRFVYCASCISHMMNDWSGVDIDRAVQYIYNSKSYEGAIAQGPGLEAHGGSSYCGVAALVLMERLQSTFSREELYHLQRWCLMRQHTGFHGRPNKPPDTCYSFWVGATLELLGAFKYTNTEENVKFLLDTQDSITGGFSKYSNEPPDPLHTYMAISGLSLAGKFNLAAVYPALNISHRATQHMKNLHQRWERHRT